MNENLKTFSIGDHVFSSRIEALTEITIATAFMRSRKRRFPIKPYREVHTPVNTENYKDADLNKIMSKFRIDSRDELLREISLATEYIRNEALNNK